MLALNYVHHGEARLVCESHEEWGRSFQALHPQLPPLTLDDVDATEGRPLVVSGLTPAGTLLHGLGLGCARSCPRLQPGDSAEGCPLVVGLGCWLCSGPNV